MTSPLLAAQGVPQPDTLELVGQVRPELPGEVRTLIGKWPEPSRSQTTTHSPLSWPSWKWVTNVPDHDYGHDSGANRPVEVTARLEEAGHAVIRITVHGRWRTL